MNDPNPAVCARVATAIEKLHDPKFTPNLLTALIDESLLVRQAIIQSLGQIGATAAIPEGEVNDDGCFARSLGVAGYADSDLSFGWLGGAVFGWQ